METLESAAPLPTCPTSTLGDLLAVVRDEAGLSVEDVSRSGQLTVEQITDVESSRYDLSPPELAAVMNSYGVPGVGARLSRHVVVISLEEGWISLRTSRRFWESTAAADQNLLRYLNLVYQHRDLVFGDRVPLRSVDLALLRASLALRREQVETHLGRLGHRIPPQLRRNKSLAAFAAAGVAVAAGGIVLLPGSSDTATTTGPDRNGTVQLPQTESLPDPSHRHVGPGPVTGPDIGTAVVVERSPDGTITRIESAPVSAPAAADSNLDIGHALVVELAATVAAPTGTDTGSPRTSRGPPNQGPAEPKGRD